MATPQPFPIRSTSGIKRDGTVFEGDNYTDGLWNRFTRRGLPKKIGGYKAVMSHLPEIIRGMSSYTIDQTNYLHLGSESFLTQVQTDQTGSLVGQVDRTPSGFTVDADNLWQILQMTNFVGAGPKSTNVIAVAAPNLSDIANSTETPIYYSPVAALTPLVATAMDPVSGGICLLAPYLFAFSNGGRVDVSAANTVLTAPNSAIVTGQKIVAGLPVRSSGGPAGILWSLDSVISAQFDASILTGIPFDFNTVSDQSSILSSQGVIEYDSIYYWIGVDRFLMYNGVVREIPNTLNLDFFFDNINFTWRQKAFAFKVPRWGEVWFCAPLGTATECNHAVIYNVALGTWYDTPLPDGGRSAGVFAQVYQRPFMCDVDLTSTGYTLWQHETGVDKVIGSRTLPIQARFQTHEISPITAPQPKDAEFRVGLVEADFVQSGDLTLTISSRNNAKDTPVLSSPITVSAVPATPQDEVEKMKVNGRLLSFIFETNTPGGNYSMGNVIGHVETTGDRYES
jgi:hypothetical protein